MKSRRPSTRVAIAAGTVLLGLSLGGCSYINPTQTHHFYQPAEGAVANFEVDNPHNPVGARNLVIIESGGKAALTGTFSNQTTSEQTVKVEVKDKGTTVASTDIPVPAEGVVALGGDSGEKPLALSGLKAKAGDNATVHLSVAGQSKELTVQILDDSLEYLGDK